MSISHDNKLLFLGYYDRTVDIVDIQEFKLIKTTEILEDTIFSITCTRDNSRVYFADVSGNIQIMTCKPNSYKKEDFDISHPTTKVGYRIFSTILINGDKELLVGGDGEVYLVDARTLDTIEVFQVDGNYVRHFGLTAQATKVLVSMLHH